MDKIVMQHPSQWIPPEKADELRRYSAEAESSKDLHPQQWAIIHERGWLKMFVPPSHGGLGWTLPQVLRMEECLSWVDGSVGWVVTLCSGAAWFVGFLDRGLGKEIFSHKNLCIAGSGSVSGLASVDGEGYRIDGVWKYASGAQHATYFTANCQIVNEGIPLRHPDGTPVIRAFVFFKDHVTIHPTWNAMGMKATGSHSFEVRDIRLAARHSFVIDTASPVLPETIYTFPFLQLAETTLSVNLSGMAIRFLDCCGQLVDSLADGERRRLLSEVVLATEKVDRARKEFYGAVDDFLGRNTNDGKKDSNGLRLISAKSHALTQTTREQLNRIYPYTGLRSADETSELNRIWRNFHTAGQHSIFHP